MGIYEGKRLTVLECLQVRLNGKCSSANDTCPKVICNGILFSKNLAVWNCGHCGFHFSFLRGKNEFINLCPCCSGVNSELVILRLEELIQELKDEIERR